MGLTQQVPTLGIFACRGGIYVASPTLADTVITINTTMILTA